MDRTRERESNEIAFFIIKIKMRIFFLFIHYNAEFLAIKETIILHFKCAPLRAFTLFPIFSNSVMWKPYHIFAHLSYLFHLIPNILLSPSAIFFLALPYQSLCVCVCPICLFDSLASLPLSPSLLCVFIIGDYYPFFLAVLDQITFHLSFTLIL